MAHDGPRNAARGAANSQDQTRSCVRATVGSALPRERKSFGEPLRSERCQQEKFAPILDRRNSLDFNHEVCTVELRYFDQRYCGGRRGRGR
jgi:hypothetical protein